MCAPGYYKANYRALNLHELLRMRGWLRFPVAFLVCKLKRPTVAGWMPSSWNDLGCNKDELSERFWQATARHRQEFEALGFAQCVTHKATRLLSPTYADNGAVIYLDQSRRQVGHLVYNRVKLTTPISLEREQVLAAFTAVFEPAGSLSCTNNLRGFDPLPNHKVTRLKSNDVASIYQRFVQQIQLRLEALRSFPDQDSLRHWFDTDQKAVLESRVRRGLFVRMTDEEVEIVRRRLPPPLPQ